MGDEPQGIIVVLQGLLELSHLAPGRGSEHAALRVLWPKDDHAVCVHGHLVAVMLGVVDVRSLSQRIIVLPVEFERLSQHLEHFLDVARGLCAEKVVGGGARDELLSLLPVLFPPLVILIRCARGARIAFVVDARQEKVGLACDLVASAKKALQLGSRGTGALVSQEQLGMKQLRLACHVRAL